MLLHPFLYLLLGAADVEHLTYSTGCFVDDHGLSTLRIVEALPTPVSRINIAVARFFFEIPTLHIFIYFQTQISVEDICNIFKTMKSH